MEIKTKTLGTVEITDEQIITLPKGFYGFEEYHRFALLDAQQKHFIWVQSLDDDLLKPLDIDSPSDVLVFALVTVPSDGSAITANLQGPLIINKKNKQGMQLVIGGEKWKIKHDIVAEMKSGGSSC